MDVDNETWLINESDRIINKKSSDGYKSLSDLEKAVYCFWVVDYSVRNSGTLQPMLDLNEHSISELIKFSEEYKCNNLHFMMELSNHETTFCENFYKHFDNACEDLRYFDKELGNKI